MLRTSLALTFLALPCATPALADSAKTALLAGACVNCHGPHGAGSGAIPSIKGRSESDLIEKMQAARADNPERGTVMPRLMRGYSDEQIVALAKWFATGGE